MRGRQQKPTPKNDPRQGLLALTPELVQRDTERRAWLEKQRMAARNSSTTGAEDKPHRPPSSSRPETRHQTDADLFSLQKPWCKTPAGSPFPASDLLLITGLIKRWDR